MRGLTAEFLAEARGELDRRLDTDSAAPVAVAVSGGGDSLAALLLTRTWAERGERPVLALTVDHGLNPDSAAWTARAGEQAQALGCRWRGLAWSAPKPATGLPAAARAARHALLAGAAREAGAAVVVVGHTADDVAEGELMRATDVPSLGRLRSWSPSPAWPEGRGVFLLRPLLRAHRGELRAWLEAQGLDWLDDPANGDFRFARPRARATLSQNRAPEPSPLPAHPRESGDPGFGRAQGCAGAPRCAPADEGAAAQAWVPAFAGMGGREGEAGALRLTRRAVTEALLAAALLCASGRSVPPRAVELDRLLARLQSGERFVATLAGARIEAGDTVLVCRELGREPPPLLPLAPGVAAIWDGRFGITAHAPGLSVVPVAGHAARLSPAERAVLRVLPTAVRPTLPLLRAEDGGVVLPAPFGPGPAHARALAPARLAAAVGAVRCERDIAESSGAPPHAAHGARRTVTLC